MLKWILTLVIALLTQLIFPWFYGNLVLVPGGTMMWVLLARNLGVIAVCVLAIIALAQQALTARAPKPATPHRAAATIER